MEKEKTIKEILERLQRLESVVFVDKKQEKNKFLKTKKDFKGITGGIRLLISRNFFKNQKKTFTSVKEALNKEGYFSSLQAIQGALDSLSTTQGPLKKIKEGKKNYYAERK